MADAATARGRGLFVATILTGSFLLFLVQPMIARIALPRLGGAPAVWNSAMLVYQALLLGGYGYAHLLGRVAPRRQGIVHLLVLLAACAFLPIGLSDRVLPAGAEPALWVPYLFVVSIGPLFFAVSAQAPLMQRWFASARPGSDPYALYAASNFGSFAGLLAFPLLVEPLLSVTRQRWLWSAGYLLLIVLVAACARLLPAGREPAREQALDPPPGRARVARWIALGFVPSGMMLATSTFVSTDLVAMPLLWVIPLSLYLLSFSIAFAARRGGADLLTNTAPVTIVLFGGVLMGGFAERATFSAITALILLFMISVALHTQLYRLRPEPARLTGFYLAMSFGGALGGVFAGLIAPTLFDWTWEYPLLIVAAGALVPQTYLTPALRAFWHRRGMIVAGAVLIVGALGLALLVLSRDPTGFREVRHPGAIFTLVALGGLVSLGARVPYLLVLTSGLLLFGGVRSLSLSLEPGARVRSYFGVYTVADEARRRTLIHGTTLHGVQLTGTPARERTPTTYYTPDSGVGRVMRAAPTLFGPGARIGVVGLGTGTLACYAQPGQRWRFFEIDPAMVALTRARRFTFVADCAPEATMVLGDARLSLERAPPASLDVLALDAFSSDAVPMHLLTREAFAAYARVLAPHGVLAVHISNRFVNLRPVVAAAARAGGWQALILDHRPSLLQEEETPSSWVVMTRDPWTLALVAGDEGDWKNLVRRPGFTPWTDDYASILPLLTF
ncbi:SAM-dependent methyltransferase [Sphingomonas endophytica]|uniref:SAM-dependent methyltransferase n=1 Tax=Sphingomonas endophytica TaxID=869719 RepID=A0A7X0JDE0_9SPHN|nr:fused MFS/spermidine synthase [Sphingomonas endophytica]MBB6505588.1 SAM-dependent methyltransferase [Sphingomonas endophytica]